MKTKKRLLIFSAALAFAAVTTPTSLFSQEDDTTAEQGTGEDVENSEELADPSNRFHKPADTWPKGDYFMIPEPKGRKVALYTHLGPTGLWGASFGQNISVKKVVPGSPAAGKVLPGDYIYGAGGKGFPAERDARYYFSLAITEAETNEAGGELVLDIRRGGQLIKVPIQLKVMGSFSATMPWNCEKSDKIVANAEEYMRRGLRPETGLPNNKQYMYGPFNDSVLFLLASGNPEMQGLVRRHIGNTIEEIDYYRNGEDVPGRSFNAANGWGIAFTKMLFGEYYHLTGDTSVLPYLEPGGFDRANNPNKPESGPFNGWTYPPTEPTRYGLHPHAHMAGTMGDVLANEAGVKVNQAKLLFDLKYLYVKRAEYSYVKYCGYANLLISGRQIQATEVIPEDDKKNGTYSAMNGKPAMAAALFSMVDGYDEGVKVCAERSMYAFNVTNSGHGGIWFNGFWTPIGASHAGPENFQHFMKGQQWWRELYRDHTGAMWQEGNARDKNDTLGTGFAIHHTIPKKRLRMFGAPRSMFGPSAPAYMNEALVAHRNRDYALAEQLTLKLQADGTVPDADKDRVSHFLDSVKTLKDSIDYDLTLTEGLLTKGNYLLARIELAQLKMVVSPNNPRLKSIERIIESKKDQLPSVNELAQKQLKDAIEQQGSVKQDRKAEIQWEISNANILLKDGAEYEAIPSRRNTVYYPKFSKNECSNWRMYAIKLDQDPPQGWEQPNFDDSKWQQVTLPSRLPKAKIDFLRTSFEVKNAAAFETLRIRINKGGQSNMEMYLNGELVAVSREIPGRAQAYDLTSGALSSLRNGTNTLAIMSLNESSNQYFTLRLEGIPRKGAESANASPKQTANTESARGQKVPKAPPAKELKLVTHHDEIEYMLAHLKEVQPKVKIGEKEYPGIEVYDYFTTFYGEHKSKVTSTDMFLDKIAFKTRGGVTYYVVDGKGNNTLLKDWLKESLPAKK